MVTKQFIWVFHGTGGRFTSGVFSTKELAEEWITRHDLEGVLTKYPLNEGVFDWAMEEGLIHPTQEQTPEFIQKYTSASLEHVHFEKDN